MSFTGWNLVCRNVGLRILRRRMEGTIFYSHWGDILSVCVRLELDSIDSARERRISMEQTRRAKANLLRLTI